MAEGKSGFGLYGVVGGMTVIELTACTKRRICGEPAIELKWK